MTQYSNGGGTTTALPTFSDFIEETCELGELYRQTGGVLERVEIAFIDKLIEGRETFGHEFSLIEICNTVGLAQRLDTIYKYITIMRKFPPDIRPCDPNGALAISHYSAVAYSGCTLEQQIALLQEFADISLVNDGSGLYHETDAGNSITVATVAALKQKATLQGGGESIEREYFPDVTATDAITAALKAGGIVDLPVFEAGYAYELKQTLVRRKKAE